jgi:phage terminase large subunit GpA-like protein
MSDNPLTNVYNRLKKKRPSSRVTPVKKITYRNNTLITKSYTKLGKKRSTSREKTILEVELQTIYDRFGDEPM